MAVPGIGEGVTVGANVGVRVAVGVMGGTVTVTGSVGAGVGDSRVGKGVVTRGKGVPVVNTNGVARGVSA
jgi:hypothetical protein